MKELCNLSATSVKSVAPVNQTADSMEPMVKNLASLSQAQEGAAGIAVMLEACKKELKCHL